MEQVEAEVVWGVRASLHDPINGLVGLSCPTTPDLRLFPDRERLTSFLLRGHQLEPARQIRQRLAAGQEITHLVPEPVARYIEQHHLYPPSR